MQIGQLDRAITIQQFTATVDGAGQEVKAWTTLAIVWARVRPQRGAERFVAAQIVGKAVTTFRIRHRTDVTVAYRLQWDSKTWDVHVVRELGRREALELDATARSEP